MNFSATPAGVHRWPGRIWRAGWLIGVFAFTGVQAAPPSVGIFRRDYRPDNVYAYPAKLSLDFRRVAVLPMAAETDANDLTEGCTALEPILFEQLVKTKRFEVVAVDRANLRRGSGQTAWTGSESLPPDFLDFLRREYDCDGVLFAELTAYHAYAPLAVGWRLKLVDVRSGQIIWAADEQFDACQPKVRRAAEHFDAKGFKLPFMHQDSWLALNSPREFGRYAAATLLTTLPDRQ